MEAQVCRRRRPALSCIECRRRKIKCDRSDPCSHCVSTKGSCSYKVYPARQQSHPDRPLHVTSRLSVDEIPPPPTEGHIFSTSHTNGMVENLPTTAPVYVVDDGENTFGRVDQHDNIATVNRSSNPASDVTKSQQYLRGSRTPLPTRNDGGSPQTGRNELVLQAHLQDAQISLDKSRVLRWRHWVSTDHEFSTIIQCMTKYCSGTEVADEDSAIAIEIHDLVLKCKSLARTIKLGRPSRFLMSSGWKFVPPQRELADELINLYLQNFESTYRITHIPTFRAEYQKYWTNPECVPINLSLKVLLALAIGSSLKRFDNEASDPSNMIHQWVYAAETWLSGPLEKDRLDMHGIQIHCLTILARQVLSIGGDLLWMSMGSLVHKAMQIGLHRDPEHLPRMSILQAEIRRRLWMTVLELVVQSSLDASMPPRISISEYDTKPPHNVNDDDMDDSTTMLRPQPLSTYTTMSMQLMLSKTLPVRLQIVQLLNGLNSELCYSDVLALSSKIFDACRECSDFANKGRKSSMTNFHQNLIDYMLRRFLLPLHCPFASQARTNPLFSYSLKVGLEAAMIIMSPEPDECYFNLRTRGGGMFKEGFRSAMTAVGLELLVQVESQRLDGTLHRKSPYRELLKQAIADLIELSIQRMRCGETNVKSHMYLSMILAQVEAVEEDVPYEDKIVEKMKESLVIGHNMLREQVQNSPELGGDDGGFSALFNGSDDYGMDLDISFFLPETSFSQL